MKWLYFFTIEHRLDHKLQHLFISVFDCGFSSLFIRLDKGTGFGTTQRRSDTDNLFDYISDGSLVQVRFPESNYFAIISVNEHFMQMCDIDNVQARFLCEEDFEPKWWSMSAVYSNNNECELI